MAVRSRRALHGNRGGPGPAEAAGGSRHRRLRAGRSQRRRHDCPELRRPRPRSLRAVVTLAAHAINEPVCVASIVRAREAFATGELRQRLVKYHGHNVDCAFRLWTDAWAAPGFEPMDANGRPPGVQVPGQATPGEGD